jgi:gliding motility-associated-like protein
MKETTNFMVLYRSSWITRCLALLFLLFSFSSVFSQPPVKWDRTLGGDGEDIAEGACYGNNGKFFLIGATTSSASGDVTDGVFAPFAQKLFDYWVVQVDTSGKKIWDRTIGGEGIDIGQDGTPTSDGGVIVCGFSYSPPSGTKSSDSKGDADYWVIRFDAIGNKVWEKTFGGDKADQALSIISLRDGNFLVAGWSKSDNGPDKTDINRGGSDVWLVKFDINGNKIWDKAFGGSLDEQMFDIVELPNGDFYIAASSESNKGLDKTADSKGKADFWMVHVDRNGNKVADYTFGGPEEDLPRSIDLLSDGTYIMSGSTRAAGGDVPNFYGGILDYFIIKANVNGTLLWSKTIGGDQLDIAEGSAVNELGFFTLSGISNSGISGNKTVGTTGGFDIWIMHMDPDGNIQWQKTIGGDYDDTVKKLFQGSNGSYYAAGASRSDISGDKSEDSRFSNRSATTNMNDMWFLKIECGANVDIGPPRKAVCPEKDIVLDPIVQNCNGCEFIWSDSVNTKGRTLNFPNVQNQKSYTLTILDRNGCIARDSILMDIRLTPIVNLGADTSIFADESLMLVPTKNQDPSFRYEWSTLDGSPTYRVTSTGEYAVTVTNLAGCSDSDTLFVDMSKTRDLFFPNAFSPNRDGLNDKFLVYPNPETVSKVLSLKVFTRWGEMIFQDEPYGTEINEVGGWDGNFKGRPAEPGTYIFTSEIEYIDSKKLLLKGDFQLFR